MTSDEWQAHVTREAAKAMGEWLEGHLHQPIAALTLPDPEAMAANVISRFMVLGSQRMRSKSDNAEARTLPLLASVSARSALARLEASATSINCDGTAFPITASAR